MLAALTLLALAIVSDPASPLAQSPAALHDRDERVLVVAHRGCWRAAPENSIAALERCIAFGTDIVEVDLRITADDKLVVFHDRTLMRMAGREEAVADLTLAELERIALYERNGGGDVSLTGETIPSFRSFVEAARGRMHIILDMKDDPRRVAPLAAAVLAELEACDGALFALVAPSEAVTSIAGPLLDCASYMPNLRGEMGPMRQAALSYHDLTPSSVAVRFDEWAYLEDDASLVQASGLRIWVNTLDDHHAAGLVDADALTNPDQLWGRLIDAGVTMIQTDEPEALTAYLAARSRRD